MNNEEIIAKIDEALKVKNFLDMYEKMAELDKEYVKSPFYKKYKLKLFDLVKAYKEFKGPNLEFLFKDLQIGIDSLDFSNLNNVLDEFAKQVSGDNTELKSSLEKIKDIFDIKASEN
jgi:hypothetical protein